MKPLFLIAALVFAPLAVAAPHAAAQQTRVLCTLVADADTGRSLIQEGDCDNRISPASTFKIAIALMGYDAGILVNAGQPRLPFKKGYVDWRPEWRRPASPASWMRESVVWYSQQITRQLGEKQFSSYVKAFGYGNRDLAGDPGKNNGLTHAWLSSSLQISPSEQVAFLGKLLRRELPVSAKAYDFTARITDYGLQPSGWQVHGKTGAGLPRDPDGSLRRGQPFGWFVGWAEKDGRRIVFARLIQDGKRQRVPPGFRARDALLEKFFASPDALE